MTNTMKALKIAAKTDPNGKKAIEARRKAEDKFALHLARFLSQQTPKFDLLSMDQQGELLVKLTTEILNEIDAL